MKKLGFTLAEVLLSLGIIGVIAAISMPTVMTETQNRTNASRLSAAVTAVETGLTSMLVDEYADDLRETPLFQNLRQSDGFSQNDAREEISRYFKTTNILFDSTGLDAGDTIQGISGNVVDISLVLGAPSPDRMTVTLKNGAFITFPRCISIQQNENTVLQNGGSTNIQVGTLFINVNGAEPPNRLGRDVFAFVIGGDGNLYPYGSITASLLIGNNLDRVWNTSNLPIFRCQNDALGEGSGCTARLIENNYRFDY